MIGLAFLSLPNPFDLLGDIVSGAAGLFVGAVSGIADSIVGELMVFLTGAILGTFVDMVASILGFFWEASEPTLIDSWFIGSGAPYHRMVMLAAPLLLVFIFLGVIQGVLKGDTAGMIRMTMVRLPGAVLAMNVTIVIADLLIRLTDDMSQAMLADFRDDIDQVETVLRAMVVVPASSTTALVLMLVFGFVGLLAAVAMIVQLFVRGALIYLIAAFSPLIFAASVWESMRGSVRKLAEIALALIISKLAIAVALAVSSAALVGSWPGDDYTDIPTPELTAEQIERSHTQSIGILLSAVVMFITAAFMPWVIYRLIPMAEGALVSQGVSPMRALHSANATYNSVMHNPATAKLRQGNPIAARKQAAKGAESAREGPSGGKKGPRSTPQPRVVRSSRRRGNGAKDPGNPSPKIDKPAKDTPSKPGRATTSGGTHQTAPKSRSAQTQRGAGRQEGGKAAPPLRSSTQGRGTSATDKPGGLGPKGKGGSPPSPPSDRRSGRTKPKHGDQGKDGRAR